MTAGDLFIGLLLCLGAATLVVIFSLGLRELAERISLWRLRRTMAKHNLPTWAAHPYDVRDQ